MDWHDFVKKNEREQGIQRSVHWDNLEQQERRMQQPSKANAIQHGGDHYKSKAIQPWDYIASNNLGYFEGNIVKYVSRWKEKNGVEDLKKARHYLDKLIELTDTEHFSS